MRDSRELVCIGCPMGCSLHVELEDGRIAAVDGYVCNRGLDYAQNEILDPRRMVTCLVRVPGSRVPLSVKTSQAIPKPLIADCLREIRQLQVSLPVAIGDIIVEDVLGTGVDLVATRSLPADDNACPIT